VLQHNAQATQIHSALNNDYKHGSNHNDALNDIRPNNTFNTTLKNNISQILAAYTLYLYPEYVPHWCTKCKQNLLGVQSCEHLFQKLKKRNHKYYK